MQEKNSIHGNNCAGQEMSWPCQGLHGKGGWVNSNGENGAEVQSKKDEDPNLT